MNCRQYPWLFTIQTLHRPCVRQQRMNCSSSWRFNLEPYQWFQWTHPKFMWDGSLSEITSYFVHVWRYIWFPDKQDCERSLQSLLFCGRLLPKEFYKVSGKKQKIYLQYGTSSATTLYDLSENSLNRSLVQALPGLHAFSGCDTTSCFEGKGTLKKHNIFSERGLASYFKFSPAKTVLIDEIYVQSKVENFPTNVHRVS